VLKASNCARFEPNVPIVVQADAKGAYGEGIDGLLGMSILSRFKLTMDSRAVRISARKR
jgi:hypothetical protein